MLSSTQYNVYSKRKITLNTQCVHHYLKCTRTTANSGSGTLPICVVYSLNREKAHTNIKYILLAYLNNTPLDVQLCLLCFITIP